MAHEIFDATWSTRFQRGIAYEWLSEQMGIPLSKCHFSMFSQDQCAEVVRLVRAHQPDFRNIESNRRDFRPSGGAVKFDAYFEGDEA